MRLDLSAQCFLSASTKSELSYFQHLVRFLDLHFMLLQLGNLYATLLWEYSNSTFNGVSPLGSNWQLQYAALTPAPNGTIS